VTATEQEILAGHAVFGHEVREVRACDGETLWAVDSTGLLWDLHREMVPGVTPYEELFVLLRGRRGDPMADGFGADYSGRFTVDQVLYMAREGFDCGYEPGDLYFRGFGNEPFWSIEVSASTIRLRQLGEPDRLFDHVSGGQEQGGVRFQADSGGATALVATITDEPCRDSMSGAYFGHTVSLSIFGDALQGCALPGRW
jgi:putative lipoprotein